MNPLVGYRNVTDHNDRFITESTGVWHDRQFLDSIIFREDKDSKYKIKAAKKEAENHLDSK